jgi:large subunit ribosomal protein L21
MYAIVEIAGQQFKVEKGRKVYVHRLEAKEGANVDFEKVMLIDNDGKINVGSPVIAGAKVSATILSHVKGDKVIIFKKKRRKGYQKQTGHRQQFTQILIEGISAK